MRDRYNDGYRRSVDREAPLGYDYRSRRFDDRPRARRRTLNTSRYDPYRTGPTPTPRRPRLSNYRAGASAPGYGRARETDPHYSRYGRVAFDAGGPTPPDRRRGWRRYLGELSRISRSVGRPPERRFKAEGEGPEELEQGVGRFARRYKEPIIGAAILGATLPFAMGSAGGQPGEILGTEAENAPIGEPVQADHPTPKGSTEEEIGGRLASLRANRAREATVNDAMNVYGISETLARQIYDAAVTNDIEPELGFGLVKTESAFDQRAVSNVGARGLTQVMPRTARWLRPGTTIEDLYNRDLNLNMGFGYLRDMIDKYKGDVRLALLAYNRGPGTVDRVLDEGGDPNNGYAERVFEGYTDLG